MTAHTEENTMQQELRKLYGETATTIYQTLAEETEHAKFLAELARVHNTNLQFAAEATTRGAGRRGTTADRIAGQMFLSLSSMLPSLFLKAMTDCGEGASFPSVRAAFLDELERGLRTLINILCSDDPDKAASEHPDVDFTTITVTD